MLKRLLGAVMMAFVAGCTTAPAMTTNDLPAVTAAAEKLRVAMIDPTKESLDALVADDLSYGHSGGKVDTKASYMADLLSGKSDFVSITITDQTVKLVGNDLAIIRHTLAAETNDSGKPGNVLLKVLGVWQRQAGQWRLLARQAVRAS